MSRRLLQIATGLLALVPIVTGAITMLGTGDPLYASSDIPALPVLDSNLRFFGGLWLGLGVALYWLLPRIERETALFRTIWGAIFSRWNWPGLVDPVDRRSAHPVHRFHGTRTRRSAALHLLAVSRSSGGAALMVPVHARGYSIASSAMVSTETSMAD
jgi:uncharacterized protein YjeT (DUF2065 family)